ncbi:MAG TPA: iron ABC transporter permease [Polyangiaceae bacterium]
MRRSHLTTALACLLLVTLVMFRLHLGPGGWALSIDAQVFALRAEGVAIAALAGTALAVAGLMMQGLFRNPLAEPGILGVGAGANLGGMLAMTLSELAAQRRTWLPNELYLVLGCLLGALLSLLVLLAVMRSLASSVTVLLTGVVLTTLFGSIGAVYRALIADKWELSRALFVFSMGDITGKGARHLLLATPLVCVGIVAALMLAPYLDMLASGEEEAATLGVDVHRVRSWSVVWTAWLVATAVSIGGGVAFVGLLVPHVMRGLGSFYHRELVITCALGGAILLIACDCLSIAVDTRSTIPLGGITGLLGAPWFLILLLRNGKCTAWN